MKFSAAKLLFGVFLLFSPLVFAQVENPIIQDVGEESTLIPIPEKINESRILPPPTTDITISNDIIVSGADAVWTPDLFSAPADVIDSTDGISFLPEAYVSGADAFWNLNLITVSSDVVDAYDAPLQNLTETFVSHADTIWATGLIEQGEGEPPPPPPLEWVEVKTDGECLYQDESGNPSTTKLKCFPNGWILKRIKESGDFVGKEIAGVIWWKLVGVTDEIVGWMKKDDLNSEQNKQTEWQEKTKELIPSRGSGEENTMPAILKTVDHYYNNTNNNPSLYSSNDNDNYLSLFKERGFPLELILAVVARESGGSWGRVGGGGGEAIYTAFNNSLKTWDGGYGVMQITYFKYKGLGSRLNVFDEQCQELRQVCIKKNEGGECTKWVPEYLCTWYTNTPQGIYTNIKDGLRALQEGYLDSLVKNATSPDIIKWAGAIWRYNHGFPRRVIEKGDEYLARIADKLEFNSQKFEILEEYFADYKTKIPNNNFLDSTKRAELVNKFKGYKTGEIKSPGELRVYDSQGKITGLINGEARNEIPDSDYYNNSFIVYTPSDSYRYEVKGTETGIYGLTLSSLVDGGITNFDATEIPTLANVSHQYTVDWESLSRGENGVTLRIDADGDGIFEKTVTADKELTKEEFLLQTESTVDFDPDTLNLKSQGKVITVYIELPAGFDVNKIDIPGIKLNDLVPALSKPTSVGDYDADGTPDLMVKFDRNKVQSILTTGEKVPIIITGKVLHDSSYLDFKGNDTIRVIK